jgi:CheY-like chemotaxis protein
VHPTAEMQSSEVLALPNLDGVHAFIVDDEPDARELLRRVLEDQGAQVTTFSSAKDVLATLKTTRPSIIVSDIGMPGMDGFQLIRALRVSESRGDRVPALALTAFARSEDRKRSLAAGYQEHLSKPFDVGELVLLVATLVEK